MIRVDKKVKIIVFILIFILIICFFKLRSPFVSKITIEAGTNIKIEDLILDKDVVNPKFLTIISDEIINKVGEHSIELSGNDKIYKLKLNVQDTIKPDITTKKYTYYIGNEFDPLQFIDKCIDETSIVAKMREDIDLNKENEYDVNVEFCDEGNNIIIKKAKLVVKKDLEPPVINCPIQINIVKGNPILYKQEVKIFDNCDGEINNFDIDNSKVNINKIGTYTVEFKATDKNGNTSKKESLVVVTSKESSEAKVEAYKYADDILSKLINKNMNKQEKLKSIYDYVMYNYTYISFHEGTIDDYYLDALNGFKTKKGDCYVVNAMARVLLERVGIETYGLVLKGNEMNHISFMANTGDGWYHYCAFKKQTGIKIYKWVDSQMIDYYSFDGITSIPKSVPKAT